MTVIRDYRPADGEQLRALWSAVGFRLIADDDGGLCRFSERNPGLFVVAEDAGQIVGSTLGGWDGRRGWLYHVATAPSHRRQGLASDLVDLVEDRLRAPGCPRALVIIEAANAGAAAFWRARAYEQRDTHQLGKTL